VVIKLKCDLNEAKTHNVLSEISIVNLENMFPEKNHCDNRNIGPLKYRFLLSIYQINYLIDDIDDRLSHYLIGHEGSVGFSVCKVHISATRWRLFTLTAVALRFCWATEKMPSSGGNKRRATAKSLNDLP
jgi:hypothetical protein